MERLVHLTVRLIQAGKRAYTRKWIFFGVFVLAFFGSVSVLGQLDLLPNASAIPAASSSAAVVLANPSIALSTMLPLPVVSPVVSSELPMKIDIAKINLSATISNPMTTDATVLDQDLLSGAVRYPTSAKLGEIGNVVLFGHSSYLPVVRNQAYKTFNGIQKLKAGDVVTVYASGTAYTYVVRSVTKESAVSDQGIPLKVSGRVLTLVTCNSFGTKEDRFVLVADFVDSHSVSS